MPRDFMFTKEEIINAALSLTRERGFSAVSARTLGEKLGTSSRPVFGRFENMEEVKSAIISAANELYQAYTFRLKPAEWRIFVSRARKRSFSNFYLCATVQKRH